MTAAYTNMIKNVLTSNPRKEDLLCTLCKFLNWGVEINHVKNTVKIDTGKATYGFNGVDDALNWFYRSGNMQKAQSQGAKQ